MNINSENSVSEIYPAQTTRRQWEVGAMMYDAVDKFTRRAAKDYYVSREQQEAFPRALFRAIAREVHSGQASQARKLIEETNARLERAGCPLRLQLCRHSYLWCVSEPDSMRASEKTMIALYDTRLGEALQESGTKEQYGIPLGVVESWSIRTWVHHKHQGAAHTRVIDGTYDGKSVINATESTRCDQNLRARTWFQRYALTENQRANLRRQDPSMRTQGDKLQYVQAV